VARAARRGNVIAVRAVVITGASRGLGAALLDELIQRGDRVLGLARSFSAAQQRVAVALPDRVNLRECDLSLAVAIPAAAELSAFIGGATETALINNAATIEPLGAVGTLDAPPLLAAVALNLTAPMLLTNAFLAALGDGSGPNMVLRPRFTSARILFISSSVARRAKAGTAAYCATKAGGEMFFDALRTELRHDARVVVTTTDPGGMDTDMHAVMRKRDGVYFPDQERLREVAASGLLPAPEVVARRILAEHLPEVRATDAKRAGGFDS
jgi:benzil reductase ((S)-benzoin forming)